MDVEGTIFTSGPRLLGASFDSTIWQGLASALGPEATRKEVETHRQWNEGRYPSYLDWMKATIAIHLEFGLTRGVFERVIESATYNPGVRETFPKINRQKFEIVLISGGFRELAARAQRDLGIHHAFAACEYLFAESGELRAYNLLPCDFEGKIDLIRLMLKEYHLSESDWIFVGDGPNDVEVAQHAPTSIGYKPHPDLARVVSIAIDRFQDLERVLDPL